MMVQGIQGYAIFTTNPQGIITSWNGAAEAMKGYSADEAIGQVIGMLYTEEDQANGRPQHNLALAARDRNYEEEACDGAGMAPGSGPTLRLRRSTIRAVRCSVLRR